MLSSFVQSHRPGPNHTCDQTANEDVIRNVHSVVSPRSDVACYRHIKRRDRAAAVAAFAVKDSTGQKLAYV
jgi:hypothetical protein